MPRDCHSNVFINHTKTSRMYWRKSLAEISGCVACPRVIAYTRMTVAKQNIARLISSSLRLFNFREEPFLSGSSHITPERRRERPLYKTTACHRENRVWSRFVDSASSTVCDENRWHILKTFASDGQRNYRWPHLSTITAVSITKKKVDRLES